MKEYNIYGGIDYCLKYLYTGLYSNHQEAIRDARISISHVENAYPKSRSMLCYAAYLTDKDRIKREDLILSYILEHNGSIG